MPRSHGTTWSENETPQRLGSDIRNEDGADAGADRRDDGLPRFRGREETALPQRPAHGRLLLQELRRDGVLDHHRSAPAVRETDGGRSGERRIPRAEELRVGPCEGADRERDPLADGLQIYLAG